MAKFQRPAQSGTPSRDVLGALYPYLLPLLVFLAITGISGQAVVGLVAVALVLSVGRIPWGNLRGRAGALTLAVAVYALIYLLSGLWCSFGAYAAQESTKMLAALAAFGLVLARSEKEGLRRLFWSLHGVLTAVSLLCIDAGSAQVLARGFSALMKLLGCSYPLETMGYEEGVRITGIFSNANVSAGLIAFGLLLGLYLYRTAGSEKARAAAAVTLGVEALAFFLSFSMGAMGSFALTCVVYLVCVGRGARLETFVLMLECVLVTLACSFGAYAFLGTGSVVPVLLAVVCGALIWVLDRFAGKKLVRAMEGRSRAVAISGGVLAAAVVLYIVLAFNLTGALRLSADETVSRAIYPDAGTYTVSVEGADPQARIYAQNEAQLMMHTETVLYEGPLSQAEITVEEGTRVVWFQMSCDGEVESVTLSDGTEVPLGYKLLPGFAANRLQGLQANQNFIQRLVFFRDGLKLWQESPVIGWGVGGVEGRITAVQSFYYESKYIHNQFIQILDEAGVVGLAAFLFLLGSAIWLLVRRRKDADRGGEFALFAACLTMMIAHSMTEVVWSTQMYQVAVFVLLAAMIVRYGTAGEERRTVRGGTCLAAGIWALAVVFAALQVSSLSASAIYAGLGDQDLTRTEFVSKLQTLDRMEVYDDSLYQATAMVNALQLGTATGRSIADGYASELMESGEFDSCYYVAAYYYLPLRDFAGFFSACRTGLEQEASNPGAWNSIAHLYAQAGAQLEPGEMEAYVDSVEEFARLLEDFNDSGRMEQIRLDEENQAFLDAAVAQADADGQSAYDALQGYFQ